MPSVVWSEKCSCRSITCLVYNLLSPSGRSFHFRAHTTRVPPVEPSAMFSTRWMKMHALVSYSVRLLSIVFLLNTGHLLGVVDLARLHLGSFFCILSYNPQLASHNVHDMYLNMPHAKGLWSFQSLYISAIRVSHTACKYEFRQNVQSHSWSYIIFRVWFCPILCREIILGIGNRCKSSTRFVVPENLALWFIVVLAEYVSLLVQQKLAMFSWSRLWGYQVDTVRDGAGRLVERANRQSFCFQLNSGRALDQIVRDFLIVDFIAGRRLVKLARERSSIKMPTVLQQLGSVSCCLVHLDKRSVQTAKR